MNMKRHIDLINDVIDVANAKTKKDVIDAWLSAFPRSSKLRPKDIRRVERGIIESQLYARTALKTMIEKNEIPHLEDDADMPLYVLHLNLLIYSIHERGGYKKVHKCSYCTKFFVSKTVREARFCSDKCRNNYKNKTKSREDIRRAVQKHRQKKHRERQQRERDARIDYMVSQGMKREEAIQWAKRKV